MKIEIGEYVRTKDGCIAKIIEIHHLIWFDSTINKVSGVPMYELSKEGYKNLVTKHSKNIIDLIEVGDYVNGEKVIAVDNYGKRIDIGIDVIGKKDIKSIVTKEQFEGVKYEIK